MRVIKDNSKRTIECNICQSILEYDFTDIKILPICLGVVKTYITCPICKHNIDMKDKQKIVGEII